jgi:hypothetical protein
VGELRGLVVLEQWARDGAVRAVNACWFGLCRAWLRFGRAGLTVGLIVYVTVLVVVGLVMGGAALWTVVTTGGADRPWP